MSLWAVLLGEQIVSLNSHVFIHSSFNDATDFYFYFLRTTEQTNTKLRMFPWQMQLILEEHMSKEGSNTANHTSILLMMTPVMASTSHDER